MRVSLGHVRRLCTERYRHIGLARKVGAAWEVHVRADARLRGGLDQAQLDREVIAGLAKSGIKSSHLDEAIARRDMVRGLDDFSCHSQTQAERLASYIVHLKATGTAHQSISRRSLERWIAAYKCGGIAALVRASHQRGETQAGVAAIAYIENIVNCGNRISLSTAITLARGEAGKHPGDPAWQIGSYSTIRIAIAARRPKILRVLSDKGERSAVAQCIPKGRRDFESLVTNEIWVGDERTLDVMVRCLGSRGWRAVRSVKITAWMDMRSRVLVGWILESHADSATILGSLKRGCANYGVPTCLSVDWGKDYKKAVGSPNTRLWKRFSSFDGQQIGGVLAQLGIDVRPVLPYTPWSKPIESFFKMMKLRFDAFFASFWGGCPIERHEDRPRWVKANLEKLPTMDELREAVGKFVATYNRTPHGSADMFGKTPLQAYEAFVGEDGLRREADSVLDHLFLSFVGPKLVRRDGVRHNCRWYGHGDTRLVAMQGQKVLLGVQPDDASKVTVCKVDDNRMPLFAIECLPLRGFSQRDAADLAKQKARLLRPFRESTKRGRRFMLETTPDQKLEQYAAGVSAVHGHGESDQQTAPKLRIRPELQEAIASAGPAPSDVLDEASTAIRTGTDDSEISLSDLLDAPSFRDDDIADENDGGAITFEDLTGDGLV
jgi:hypothetical protein